MRRSVLLVLSVALAVLVFAPVAAAQSDDMGADDRSIYARGADDRGMDDRGFDDRGMDDDATASPSPAPRPPRALRPALRPLQRRAALSLPRARPSAPPLPLRASFPTPVAFLSYPCCPPRFWLCWSAPGSSRPSWCAEPPEREMGRSRAPYPLQRPGLKAGGILWWHSMIQALRRWPRRLGPRTPPRCRTPRRDSTAVQRRRWPS